MSHVLKETASFQPLPSYYSSYTDQNHDVLNTQSVIKQANEISSIERRLYDYLCVYTYVCLFVCICVCVCMFACMKSLILLMTDSSHHLVYLIINLGASHILYVIVYEMAQSHFLRTHQRLFKR